MSQIDNILTPGLQDTTELETAQLAGDDADYWAFLFGSNYAVVIGA